MIGQELLQEKADDLERVKKRYAGKESRLDTIIRGR